MSPYMNIKLRTNNIKMCDNTIYGNNYGGYGNNCYCGQCYSGGRVRDKVLVKKELYYVETYLKEREEECCNCSQCSGYNNYGYGGNQNYGYSGCQPPYYNGCNCVNCVGPYQNGCNY